ncbi:MAG: FAD-linked oxidase C-terminal domain-containing protein [Acidimicrobiales bacterium]
MPDGFAELAERLRCIVGRPNVLTSEADLRVYECDGLAHYRAVPGLVVLPDHADQVQGIIGACVEADVPFVVRGSGTGLSGGALPDPEGVLIVLSRLKRIVEIDVDSSVAVVEPGVINLEISRAAANYGLYFAPDPSSQQVCSIGGNVAENSGGAHCLKYGFTSNHVTGVRFVMADGTPIQIGGKALEHPGYDLLGVIVGSEGTLGAVTEATVHLTKRPEHIQTLLASFATLDEAGEAVTDLISSGILPAAVEMMDTLAIEAAEAATQCGYPQGATAILIVELDGEREQVEEQFTLVQDLCWARHAYEVRVAASEVERVGIWKGRKSAFAAVGRISPDYLVQDGVIPRTELGAVLGEIARLAARRNVRVANVFHAGDGNLHPLVLFDSRDEGAFENAEEVAGEILRICLAHGGSITGEHGVGVEKKSYLGEMFSVADLDTMQMVRCAFDPEGRSNPGKVFPTPRLCGEVPGHHRGVHPLVSSGQAELY